MAENNREELFTKKYGEVEKIWSGPSFIQYRDFRILLEELPVSAVAVSNQTYSRKFPGNLEYVYGEMLYSLTGFEGYLRDKAFKLEECYIRTLIGRNTYILEFDIRYRTRSGEEVVRPAEVLRLGETKFIFYTDYYRPM
ncbi:MAG: hypothetical protein ACOZFS_01750 [Thermodesulfobacteriota bacterium]